MWADVFIDTCLFSEVFNNVKDHHPRQIFTVSVQKQIIFKTFFNGLMYPKGILVNPDEFYCLTSNGHQAFFISFANYSNKIYIQIQATNF